MDGFKEIILFALSCIGAVIVLTLFSVFSGLTAQMAETRHDEIRDQYAVEFERQYGVYHESEISGIEVIALLRENALNKARCTIVIDENAAGNPMTQNMGNYSNFTFASLRTLIASDDRYHVTVNGDTLILTRR